MIQTIYIPLALVPLALLAAPVLRRNRTLVTASFIFFIAFSVVVVEKLIMASIGVSRGRYVLVGFHFSFWLIPIAMTLVCLLYRSRITKFSWVSLIPAYTVSILFALVRPSRAVVDLVNGDNTIFVRFSEQVILTFALLASVLVPSSCLGKTHDTPTIEAPVSGSGRSNYRPIFLGSLAYVIVYALGSVVLQAAILDLRLIIPFSALLEFAFLKGIYFHLIDQYLAFSLSAAVLSRFTSEGTGGYLEMVFGAGLYAMLHYYMVPGFLVWAFFLGLPLAYLYRETGKLRYGVILALLFDIFTR